MFSIKDRVQQVRHELSQVYHADASNKETIQQLGFHDLDVLIGMGHTDDLKELTKS